MSIKCVSDIDHPLIVGERYKVECLKAKIGKRLFWLPVLCSHVGDFSEENHFHLDSRFLTDFFYKLLNWKPHYVFGVPDDQILGKRLKIKTCVRQFGIPHTDQVDTFRKLQNLCKNRIVNCLTCPHQGVDLSQVPVINTSNESVRYCPAHGLKWSAEDGRMIERDSFFEISGI